jgi:hypothetical protein
MRSSLTLVLFVFGLPLSGAIDFRYGRCLRLLDETANDDERCSILKENQSRLLLGRKGASHLVSPAAQRAAQGHPEWKADLHGAKVGTDRGPLSRIKTAQPLPDGLVACIGLEEYHIEHADLCCALPK